MTEKIASIIIPVYNTENYLKRCFDSIINQEYQNFEAIIIDDGSTDGSENICKSYCNVDKRFKYFNQKNSGVSIARNKGLNLATGDYISFLDSDDWYDKNFLSEMIANLENNNADSIICDVYETNENKIINTTLDTGFKGLISKKDLTVNDLNMMCGAVWRCIFKKEIIYGLRFVENLKLSEDKIFCLEAFGKSNSIFYLKEPLYYRFIRTGSAVYSYHSDMDKIQFLAYENMNKTLRKYWNKKYYKISDLYLYQVLFEIFISICDSRNNLNINGKMLKIKEICCNKDVEKIANNKKYKSFHIKLVKNKEYFMIYLVSIAHIIKRKIK